MDINDKRKILEIYRAKMHAVADLICNMIEVKLDSDLDRLSIRAGQEKVNANDIARQMLEQNTCSFRELGYALSTGKLSKIKPYGIKLSTGRKVVVGASWTELIVSILQECASIPEYKEKMLKEAETKSHGQRPYLGSNPSTMLRPKKIVDGLYFNASSPFRMFNYLMKVLDKVGFDYSSIEVMLRPALNRQRDFPAKYADGVPLERACKYAIGRRPTTLKFPDGREIHVKSWKQVIKTIFEDCCKDSERLNKLKDMAGQLSTRNGLLILSKDQEQIRESIKIPGGLYATANRAPDQKLREAYRILNAAGYDYANISVQIEGNNNVQAPSEQQTTEENVEQEEDIGPAMLM